MNSALHERLHSIDWAAYETAYGPASNVPSQLLRLTTNDHHTAMKASHDLWCGLCHQHAYASSAALPELPFILEALEHADEALTIEILDLVCGIAVCTEPDRSDYQPWMQEARTILSREIHRFGALCQSSNEYIADFADRIVEALTAP